LFKFPKLIDACSPFLDLVSLGAGAASRASKPAKSPNLQNKILILEFRKVIGISDFL
jgi:hypothetical protein